MNLEAVVREGVVGGAADSWEGADWCGFELVHSGQLSNLLPSLLYFPFPFLSTREEELVKVHLSTRPLLRIYMRR